MRHHHLHHSGVHEADEATLAEEPTHDVGGGRLAATVTDPDVNVPGLLQDQ